MLWKNTFTCHRRGQIKTPFIFEETKKNNNLIGFYSSLAQLIERPNPPWALCNSGRDEYFAKMSETMQSSWYYGYSWSHDLPPGTTLTHFQQFLAPFPLLLLDMG